MPGIVSRKKSDQMMDIAQLYLESGGKRPLSLEDLAKFAIANNHWEKAGIRDLQLRLCKREFSRAFREQHHRDPQGRLVRTLHSTREGKQSVFWDDIRNVDDDFAQLAFQQRRAKIVGDCRQLKTDVDSYNDNNKNGGYFQLPLDFAEDVAEREQPTVYVPRKPR
jgi:hypothetical protein